ncbi:chitinase-like protein PB1E7.04c [Acropora millepora]|uniref:chitinase-like protein PB1E7.04c n=1 Tax=Acropora millepora TaxID=45264 RepID=UPI001CF2D54B|nr:chitinase-like protein PB1E7.04c [Acropora millepora]
MFYLVGMAFAGIFWGYFGRFLPAIVGMNTSSFPANSVSSIESHPLDSFTPRFTVTTNQSLSNANVLSLIRVTDSASQANLTSISGKMEYGIGYSAFTGVKTVTSTQEIVQSLSKHRRSKSISHISNTDEKSSFSSTKALLASERGTPTYTFPSDLSMTSEVEAIVSMHRKSSFEATTFSSRYTYPVGRSTEELTPLNFTMTTRERKSTTLQNAGNLSTTASIKIEETTIMKTSTLGYFVSSIVDNYIHKTITSSNAYNISMRISLNQGGSFPTAIRERTSMVNRKSAEPSTSPNRFVSSRYSARRTTEGEHPFYISTTGVSAAIKASTPSVLQNTLTINVLTLEAITRKNEISMTSFYEKASNLVSTSMERKSDSTNSPSKIMHSQVASETQEHLTSNVGNSRLAQHYSLSQNITTQWSDKIAPTESTLTKSSTFTVSSSKPQPVSSKITMTDHKGPVTSTKISSLSTSSGNVTSLLNEPSKRSSGLSFISPSNFILSSTLHTPFTESLVVVTSYTQSTPNKGNYPYMTDGTSSLQTKHSMIKIKTSGQSDSSKISRAFPSLVMIPSISLDTISSTMALYSSTSASTDLSRPPSSDPINFQGMLILQMPWDPQYQSPFSQEFRVLANKIKTELTKAFRSLEDFLSVQVQRFWKGSVGVDFLLLMSSQVDQCTIERTLTNANSTALLDLPLTFLQITKRDVSTATPNSDSKSLERWEIILIVAAILVFFLLLILCVMAVKLVRQGGGFGGRKKYDISNRHRKHLCSERNDSVTISRSNLPVILSMEERGQSLSGKPPPYGNTKSNSLEQLVEGKQGRRGADYREQDDKDHLYEEPITIPITRKKGVGNPAYDGDGTQLQMSTFKPDSLGDREFIGRPTTLESSMIKKGNNTQESNSPTADYQNEDCAVARL